MEPSKEQAKLREQARELAHRVLAPRAAEVDRTEAYPFDNVAALRDASFMGMTLPTALGGQGRSLRDATIVIEELAAVCGTTGRIAVEANMGALSAIVAYGTEAQKRLAASLVLEGDKPAICITEPEAGSAASELETRADRYGERYVLNGKKHWITGGGVSRLHLIFARVFDHGVEQGIGGFIVVRGEQDGLRVGRRIPAMGIRGMPETELHFEDLVVPATMVLTPPGGLRRGFGRLMDAYNTQRVGAATVALGIARGAFEVALDFVKERHQFGRPICEFQGLQWMLADMSVQIEAARALVQQAAASAGTSGFPDMTVAARAKIFASEMAIKVTNDALQLHGAAGYGRDLPLERMVRDARMFTIGGGTAQILRNLVAASLLDRKLPQRRDGYAEASAPRARQELAEV